MDGGRRRSGMSVKALKRTLKKAGLKVSGKKSTLRARAKKARLMGGAEGDMPAKPFSFSSLTTKSEDEAPPATPATTTSTGARRHRRSRSRRGLGLPRLY